jgi:hypothetical protein
MPRGEKPPPAMAHYHPKTHCVNRSIVLAATSIGQDQYTLGNTASQRAVPALQPICLDDFAITGMQVANGFLRPWSQGRVARTFIGQMPTDGLCLRA